MRTIRNKMLIAIGFIALGLSGCNKQIETAPTSSIPAEEALDSRDEINASIVTMYSILKSPRLYGRDLIALPEALADNGFATNKSGRLVPEYLNTFGAHFTSAVWTNSYAAINQINLTLEAIPRLQLIPAATAAEIASWQGQLYFLRALYYFELMRVYAYTPLKTVPEQDRGGVVVTPRGFMSLDSARQYLPGRQSVDSVYNYIIADMKRAAASLANNTSERNLATKGAAQALLSRIYLYDKNYDSAKVAADNAIALLGGAARLTDLTDYVTNWRSADNKETIFQIRFALNSENIGVNESLQTTFTTLVTPGSNSTPVGFGDLVPTYTLLSALGITLFGGNTAANFQSLGDLSIASRSGDIRNQLYEVGAPRSKRYIECTKFLGKNGFPNLDNVPVIRMSEVYLNRAEALGTPGAVHYDHAAALADLQLLKSKRIAGYDPAVDAALSNDELYEEILNQRRIELAFEGQRFFDLKRLGRDIPKTLTPTVQFTDPRILAPILQADVDGNPNLQQNFGY